jgi:hypothetical protein
MIEEAIVVILLLKWNDLALDKLVYLAEEFGNVFGNAEIHDVPPIAFRRL